MAQDNKKDGRKGSFRTRSNGRVEYIFRYTDEFGRTKVKSISGGNEKECIKRADEWLRNYKESVKKIDQNATIPEILKKKYENDRAMNLLSESGLRTNLSRVRIIERSLLGHIGEIYPDIFQSDGCSVFILSFRKHVRKHRLHIRRFLN